VIRNALQSRKLQLIDITDRLYRSAVCGHPAQAPANNIIGGVDKISDRKTERVRINHQTEQFKHVSEHA